MNIKGKRNKFRVKRRQEEAVERQTVRDKRTHEEQLKLIKTRLGESKKEKRRLVGLIEEDNKREKKKKKKGNIIKN